MCLIFTYNSTLCKKILGTFAFLQNNKSLTCNETEIEMLLLNEYKMVQLYGTYIWQKNGMCVKSGNSLALWINLAYFKQIKLALAFLWLENLILN